MKKQTTISKKLFSSFGALIALTAGISLYSMLNLSSLNVKINKLANVTARRQFLLGDLSTRLADLLSAERGVLLHASGTDKEIIERLAQEGAKSWELGRKDAAEIAPLVETPQGRQFVGEFQERAEPVTSASRQIGQLVNDGKADQALEIYKSAFIPAVAKLRASTESLRQLQAELMRSVAVSSTASASRSRWIMNVGILLALLVGLCVVWVVRSIHSALRQFLTDLSVGGQQVASAASQIAGSSQSLSQGSSQQAASLEEISASMEEMTAMSKRNCENSGEATGMMTETAAQVDRSNLALKEMVVSMSAIKASSEKVAKIIKTIDEIAFQTNILALNAAVEAARAGEAGMGFAVVADEVRNLAQRSAVAAKDTAGLIEEAITNSNQGADNLERVAVAIRAITESASKVKNLVAEVSESSKQQTQGINQTSTAITQVSKVTQTAAASAEESAAASEELSAQAQGMQDLVQVLRGMLDGRSAIPAKAQAIRQSVEPVRRPVAPSGSSKPARSRTLMPPPSDDDPFPMEAVEVGNFKSF